MRGLGPFLRDAWFLSRPYFRSEERRSAWALLITIVAMNLAMVGMLVVLNYWRNAEYNSLQTKDWPTFIRLIVFYVRADGGSIMPGLIWIIGVYVAIAVYARYLQQWLGIRWRRWMTTHLVHDWLSDRAYYKISLRSTVTGVTDGTDNPDQRVAEDARDFTESTLSLGVDLLSNVVTLFSFVGVLWGLSGSITVLGVTIPAYLVWVALAYAILGTVATHFVGRPLALLNFAQQRFEANFRFGLVRVRENTEGIALYGGEAEEQSNLHARFSDIYANFRAIMSRKKLLNTLVLGYSQVSGIFPMLVMAPRYFFGDLKLGGLMQTVGAFSEVQGAMSWFIESYSLLAEYRATTERLATFGRSIESARISTAGLATGVDRGHAPGRSIAVATSGANVEAASASPNLVLDDVTLSLPDGSTLLDHVHLDFPRGRNTVISGRSGTGKSTLFRAIAGIWPFAQGTIRRPSGSSLFLPQRPYIPLGTLRHAVCYPAAPGGFDSAQVEAALRDAGLDALVGALDDDAPWGQRLSGGEQQRLAVARALLLRPDWLFLDEATANLDPESETALLRTLRERLPGTTMVSITHGPGASEASDRVVRFSRDAGGEGRLEDAAAA